MRTLLMEVVVVKATAGMMASCMSVAVRAATGAGVRASASSEHS